MGKKVKIEYVFFGGAIFGVSCVIAVLAIIELVELIA